MYDKRLIVFAVLPSRQLAAAFVALGTMLGGARLFEDALSWPRFREKPIGTVVHWKERKAEKHFSGIISAFQQLHGSEFITLQVTKPAHLAKKGLTVSVSQHQFDSFFFTEDAPPTAVKSSNYSRSELLLTKALGQLSPKWIWADGAECLLVTQMATFESQLADLSLSCDDIAPMPILDLLCLAGSNDSTHAKLRISHPRGKIDGPFPLAILDGLEAFYSHQHLAGTSNLVTILDRSEYSEGVQDIVLQLATVACDERFDDPREFPTSFPPGVELAAYVVSK